jgi:hypothetical protein
MKRTSEYRGLGRKPEILDIWDAPTISRYQAFVFLSDVKSASAMIALA